MVPKGLSPDKDRRVWSCKFLFWHDTNFLEFDSVDFIKASWLFTGCIAQISKCHYSVINRIWKVGRCMENPSMVAVDSTPTHVSYNTMVTEWENFQNWAIQPVNSQETFYSLKVCVVPTERYTLLLVWKWLRSWGTLLFDSCYIYVIMHLTMATGIQ